MSVCLRFENKFEGLITSDKYGPFKFIQITHKYIRVWPGGEKFAAYDGQTWAIKQEDGSWAGTWTDVVIYSEEN